MNTADVETVWARLQREVIRAGLCTHCGTCAGLSGGALQMVQTPAGPLPMPVVDYPLVLDPLADACCPGRGSNYPALYRQHFGQLPDNWLLGCNQAVYIGHATRPEIRRRAASGGVITQTLLHLLASGRIDGAVVVRQGQPQPWLAAPVIARTPAEIVAAAQSVYIPTPVNLLLDEMAAFPGRLAYVGLPDQVAALRRLQAAGHPGAGKVDYVLGPYVGTAIYLGAIESYLRSNGIRDLAEVAELKWREGEWPGYLHIRTRSGRVLQAKKFYYNYLIPFYITQASLLGVDFTNELTDISVGDAWHPRYEAQGGGFSVVVARTAAAAALLAEMAAAGLLALNETSATEALSMHGHMLDFKKRGTFIRLDWRRARGRPVPDYGYRPGHIPASRKLVELFLAVLFGVCGSRPGRKLIEWLPLSLVGPLFDNLRKGWKNLSKPVKRQGLANVAFVITTPAHHESRTKEHAKP
ncbi:MAG: Coenzyme F420 hydrogenase/dehydrogenase, beta subunit C-terminal domain [Ardenticatenaceae bacterium]|nr:Coenzyme F420 hydrogenase/dehydrogenase, beta subunit C-terminal domain [Ardenticatenaceae bacterium]